MTTTILAEMGEEGLYACGSVNLVIGLIFLSLMVGVVGSVIMALHRASFIWLAIGVLLFMPGVPIGFFTSAYLAQDSCAAYEEDY